MKVKRETATVIEAGQKGGLTTRDRYGANHFRRIGKLGGKRTAELYRESLRGFGKMGGRPRRPNLK